MGTALIRLEAVRDREAVRHLNEAAFGGPVEADLIEALHRENALTVALVAQLDGEVVGHIVFSPVSLEPATAQPLVGLGPMAVAPPFQRRGIGMSLVQEGLNRCRAAGAEAVVVVGHAEYYPRFGFRPAHQFGLRCEFDVPGEAFMALELAPNSLQHVSGVVRYHHTFSQFAG